MTRRRWLEIGCQWLNKAGADRSTWGWCLHFKRRLDLSPGAHTICCSLTPALPQAFKVNICSLGEKEKENERERMRELPWMCLHLSRMKSSESLLPVTQ